MPLCFRYQVLLVALLTIACFDSTECIAIDPIEFPQGSSATAVTAPAKRFDFSARASEIDRNARSHPEIDFVFEKDGKPQDVQHAAVDTRVPSQGKLVIWLMGPNQMLFDQLSSYGFHVIRVHYANGWFSKFGKEPPPSDDQALGKIRLEAATGEDFSDLVTIPKADGMKERARQFVVWLKNKNPEAQWGQFLTTDGNDLNWEKVVMAGASHGATTSARFAIHQRVDRVVMFCGPRDQYETWQSLPSATPSNRFFGFSHVLDGGWKGSHYCRSWELLGLNQFGAIVNVDNTLLPYANSRRLITSLDVRGDENRAHNCVVPGNGSIKNSRGEFAFEPVWKYLFLHSVDSVGQPVPPSDECRKNLRK